MAVVIYSSLVKEVKGKAGGVIYQKGNYRNILRNTYIPRNPQTLKQTEQRARVRQVALFWSTLTQAERDTWTTSQNVRTQTQRKKKTGDTITLNGFNFFQQTNIFALLIGRALHRTYTNAGAVWDGVPTELKIDLFLGSATLFISKNTRSNIYVLAYFTPKQNQGRKNFSGLYRFAGSERIPVETNAIYLDYIWQRYYTGGLVAGDNISCKITILSSNDIYTASYIVPVQLY